MLRHLHLVSLVCELGIMAVTMIKLEREAAGTGGVAQTVALILLSLVTTMGSFIITLIAIQKLFKTKIQQAALQEAGTDATDTALESESRIASVATWL